MYIYGGVYIYICVTIYIYVYIYICIYIYIWRRVNIHIRMNDIMRMSWDSCGNIIALWCHQKWRLLGIHGSLVVQTRGIQQTMFDYLMNARGLT